MPRHTPSPGRQLGSYLHDTKFPWSLDHYNARRGRAELEARLALDLRRERSPRSLREGLLALAGKNMAFSKLAALLALAVGANAADDQVVVGQTFMAGAIDPTSGSTGWALTSHGISEKLFTVDKKGNIVGQVAESVERVSDNVWEVTLDIPLRRAVVLVLRSGLPTLVKILQ